MAKKLAVIIDNRGDNKVLYALQKLLPNLQKMDIATGVFKIGSFLLLEGFWQYLDKIRILMGGETRKRTKREILKARLEASNESIEQEKERDVSNATFEYVFYHNNIFKVFCTTYSMAKIDSNFYELSYLGKRCSPLEIPFEFLKSGDFSKLIWLPDKNMDQTICYIKDNYPDSKSGEEIVSPGQVIDYYLINDIRIRLIETLPAIQLRCLSMSELEKITEKLSLPIVYGSVHKPSHEVNALYST